MSSRDSISVSRSGVRLGACRSGEFTVLLPTCNPVSEELSPKAWAKRRDEASLDVADCLARVREQDEDAARLLMDHLYPLVLKVVRAHLPRRVSEEDLVQTVFMKVFSKLDQYLGQVPVEHWVSRIAVNTCFNELKAERVRPEWRWADLTEDEQRVVESITSHEMRKDEVGKLAARDLLDRLMAALSPPDRLVIRLLHLEERSVEEIRKMTGWSVPLVKVRAFRARKKLKKLFDQLTKEEQR